MTIAFVSNVNKYIYYYITDLLIFVEYIDLNCHIESSIRLIQSVGGNIEQVEKYNCCCQGNKIRYSF
jgi:hypothetical protein